MMQPTLPDRDARGRIVSVSTAPYDGYAFPRMLESLASLGVRHVEPAFIAGYTEPFDESVFTGEQARRYVRWLDDYGLHCHAFSSHIDLGRAGAADIFKARMDFARRLGARVINTNAALRRNAKRFYANMEKLAHHAERLDMWIGLENPGDGSDNLINVAADGPEVLERTGSARVGLNYDAGNTVSHRPGLDAVADAVAAIPLCVHVHINDVRVNEDGYFFSPLGEGRVGCEQIVRALAHTALDVSIELPLRRHRGPDARASRKAWPVPLADIEAVLRAALRFIRIHLNPEARA